MCVGCLLLYLFVVVVRCCRVLCLLLLYVVVWCCVLLCSVFVFVLCVVLLSCGVVCVCARLRGIVAAVRCRCAVLLCVTLLRVVVERVVPHWCCVLLLCGVMVRCYCVLLRCVGVVV